MTAESSKVLKVAVHREPYITDQGHKCYRWYGYHVYAGENPEGPRRGRCGNCVHGEDVSGQLRSRALADDFAARFAQAHHGVVV